MSDEQKFLDWLDEQSGYYVKDAVVEERFPDLEYQMIGVTKTIDEETGDILTPKRDWIDAVMYGGVVD